MKKKKIYKTITLSEVLDADDWVKYFPAGLLVPVMKKTGLVRGCTYDNMEREFRDRGWTYRKEFKVPLKTEEPAVYFDREMLVNTAKWFVSNALNHHDQEGI